MEEKIHHAASCVSDHSQFSDRWIHHTDMAAKTISWAISKSSDRKIVNNNFDYLLIVKVIYSIKHKCLTFVSRDLNVQGHLLIFNRWNDWSINYKSASALLIPGTTPTFISPNDIITSPRATILGGPTIHDHSRKLIWRHSPVFLILPGEHYIGHRQR